MVFQRQGTRWGSLCYEIEEASRQMGLYPHHEGKVSLIRSF